jgi:Methyltransferase domain
VWEFCAIAGVLEERDMLRPGLSGLGFAVGTEPLSFLFASYGVKIIATDLAPEATDESWIATGQHASSVDVLFQSTLIEKPKFDDLVFFRHADMRALDDDLGVGQFDFLWSSCAFEHLGSLQAGTDFVLNAMRFLRPGGVAVHTTEYNVSSNDDTLTAGVNVIYRRRDIEQLALDLRKQCCGLEAVDFDPGTHIFDLNFDRQPFYKSGRRHIKLELGGYICTSILLVIHKG